MVFADEDVAFPATEDVLVAPADGGRVDPDKLVFDVAVGSFLFTAVDAPAPLAELTLVDEVCNLEELVPVAKLFLEIVALLEASTVLDLVADDDDGNFAEGGFEDVEDERFKVREGLTSKRSDEDFGLDALDIDADGLSEDVFPVADGGLPVSLSCEEVFGFDNLAIEEDGLNVEDFPVADEGLAVSFASEEDFGLVALDIDEEGFNVDAFPVADGGRPDDDADAGGFPFDIGFDAAERLGAVVDRGRVLALATVILGTVVFAVVGCLEKSEAFDIAALEVLVSCLEAPFGLETVLDDVVFDALVPEEEETTL